MRKAKISHEDAVYWSSPLNQWESSRREHFRRKLMKSRPTSYLKKEHFRRKNEIEAHFLFEKGALSTEINEIEADRLFEKGAFSTKINDAKPVAQLDAHSVSNTTK